mmetsp:Transcript_11257/g.17968  ORF Transcript_11257/g.17968 Transcript_11257/m.17968 type:complete len:111 (+) Transcript_11257:970-1302(+)
MIPCEFFKMEPQDVGFLKTKSLLALDIEMLEPSIRLLLAFSRKSLYEAPTWDELFKGSKSLPELVEKISSESRIQRRVEVGIRVPSSLHSRSRVKCSMFNAERKIKCETS